MLAAQLTAAVYLVSGHEGGADPQRLRMFQEGGSQLRLGGEQYLLRHAGQLAVPLIGGAPLGQVQRAPDQRVPAAGGIGHGDRHLAQRDAAQGAAVLAGRAGAVGRGLFIGGFVHDQHRVPVIEMTGRPR